MIGILLPLLRWQFNVILSWCSRQIADLVNTYKSGGRKKHPRSEGLVSIQAIGLNSKSWKIICSGKHKQKKLKYKKKMNY